MFGLGFLDIAIILAYFIAVIVIGLWSASRVKNQEDYFLAGRRFGKLIQTFAAFGQGTSSDSAVGVTTTTFKNGAAGIWSALNLLFATPVFWLVSPCYRRLRILTLGDFFEERYDSKPMAGTYAVFQVLLFMLSLSLAFNAMSKTVMALTPKTVEQMSTVERAEHDRAVQLSSLESMDYSQLSSDQMSQLEELRIENPKRVFSGINKVALISVVSIIILLYAVSGGLEAAFITDTLQGVCIIILSVLLIPFIFMKINTVYGGSGPLEAFRILHDKLPESIFDIFGSPSTMDFTWYYILALCVMNMAGVVVQANQLVANGSAKDEYTARFGFTTGMYMKRICTLLWGLLALAAILLYSDSVRDPDLIWGYTTRDLLGPLNAGFIGLMIACLMAAAMSTADCFMITTSSLLTHNVYRPLFPGKDEKSYVRVGRFLGAITIIGGAVLALTSDSLLQQMKIIWEFGIIFAAPFWFGMLWRRTNRQAAWMSIVVTLAIFFLLPLIIPAVMPSLRENDYLLKMTAARSVDRRYVAREMDVTQREAEIKEWDQQNAVGNSHGDRPEMLVAGKGFTKTYSLPRKDIFWTKEIKKDDDDRLRGYGMLSLELVLYDKLGFDLSKNPYALNETLRILTRTIVPFIIILILSFITRDDNDKEKIDRFFVKMKTRVIADRDKDDEQLRLSYADPSRFDHLKMFPNSKWEMMRWTKVDIVGFAIAVLVAFAIVAALYLMISIGGSIL